MYGAIFTRYVPGSHDRLIRLTLNRDALTTTSHCAPDNLCNRKGAMVTVILFMGMRMKIERVCIACHTIEADAAIVLYGIYGVVFIGDQVARMSMYIDSTIVPTETSVYMRAKARGTDWKVPVLHVSKSGFINCAGIGTSTGVYLLPTRDWMELSRFSIGGVKMSYIALDGRINGVMLNPTDTRLAFFQLKGIGINVTGSYDPLQPGRSKSFVYYVWPFKEQGIRPLSVNLDPVQVLLMIRRGDKTLLYQPDESFMKGIAKSLHNADETGPKVTINAVGNGSSNKHLYITNRGLIGYMGHPSWYTDALNFLEYGIKQHVKSPEFIQCIRRYREIIPTSVWIPGADYLEDD